MLKWFRSANLCYCKKYKDNDTIDYFNLEVLRQLAGHWKELQLKLIQVMKLVSFLWR